MHARRCEQAIVPFAAPLMGGAAVDHSHYTRNYQVQMFEVPSWDMPQDMTPPPCQALGVGEAAVGD